MITIALTHPFSGILQAREGVSGSSGPTPCILASDATATTGRLGIGIYSKGSVLIGLDHKFDKCASIILDKDHTSDLVTSDGQINGFEAVAQLEEEKQIQRATHVNALIIVPLVERSFHYGLVTFPVGNYFNSVDLYRVYRRIADLAKGFGLNIISLVGDGDSRLRKMQYDNYLFFPTSSDFLTKL